MFSEQEVKELLCEIGNRIYKNGFVAANDGNISVRINDTEILCTPTGVSKGYMTPEMICKVNLDGEIISANDPYRPSSEVKMHLRVYKERQDVRSVVHAHPPYGTSYAIAGVPLNKPLMPEAVIFLGEVPIVPYGTPSTNEIPEAISKYLDRYDALLLENHGALTYGRDLMSAYYKMESLEFYAKLTFISSQIGDQQVLKDLQIEKLLDIRRTMNLPGKHPGLCENSTLYKNNSNEIPETYKNISIDEKVIEKIVKEVTIKVIEEIKM